MLPSDGGMARLSERLVTNSAPAPRLPSRRAFNVVEAVIVLAAIGLLVLLVIRVV